MAINMTVRVTSGTAVTEVPEEVAADLQEAWELFQTLPSNRVLDTDPFPTEDEARLFTRQGKAWAERQVIVIPESTSEDGTITPARETPLTFERKGNIKDIPLVVTFRIYIPSPRGPLTEEEKAQRAATREANRLANLKEVEENL